MYDIKALYEAESVVHAVQLLLEHPAAQIIAGGSDVLVQIREGRRAGAELVSIYGLDELRGVSLEADGTIRIGSLTSFSHITRDPIIQAHINVLGQAVDQVGGPQIRNIGTIGGNTCNGVTSADSASTLFAWDAVIEITGPVGVRRIPIRDFYIKAGKVDLRPGELQTAILIPRASYEGYEGHYIKYAMRNAMDIATTGCSVNVKLSADKSTMEDVRIAYGTDKAGANAIFYTYNGAQYYIYVEGTSLVRVKVDAAATSFVGEKVYIENGLTASSSDSSDSSSSSASATFLFIDNGYLYYAQSGSSGNNVYRINCVGDKASYNNIGKTEEYKSVKVLDIEYNSSWYKPELVKSGEKSFLFFANVASYSDDYIYAVACPATNAELKEINDKYEDVQDIFTDISEKYSDASNAAKYYFYTADKDILTSEDYTEEYTDDEKAVFDAFVNCTAYAPLFDASVLKDDSQVWNVRSYFMNVVGKVADSDAESIADSLKSDLLAAIS